MNTSTRINTSHPDLGTPLSGASMPMCGVSESIVQGPHFCGTFIYISDSEVVLRLRSLPHVTSDPLVLEFGPFPSEHIETFSAAVKYDREVPRNRDPFPAIHNLERITEAAYEADYDASFRLPDGQNGIETIHQFCHSLIAKVSDEAIRDSIVVHEDVPGVICLDFPNHHLLTSSFLRIAEHYESPRFRNKVFRHEEFIEWYRGDDPAAAFTYFDDWTGYFVPGYIIDRFRSGEFNPLERRERILLSLIPERSEPIAIIGMARGDPETHRHELCHALYYLSPSYKAEVEIPLQKIDVEPIAEILREFGYTEEVIRDEENAYLCDSGECIDERPIDSEYYGPVHLELNAIFERHLAARKAGRVD